MNDEGASCRRKFGSEPEHRVLLGSGVALRSGKENALTNMRAHEGRRGLLHDGTAQGNQSAHVVPMPVAEDQFRHGRQVDSERATISLHHVLVSTRIEQDPAAVHFDQRRKTPFAERTAVRQHR